MSNERLSICQELIDRPIYRYTGNRYLAVCCQFRDCSDIPYFSDIILEYIYASDVNYVYSNREKLHLAVCVSFAHKLKLIKRTH